MLTQIDWFLLGLNMLLTRRVFVGMGKIWVVSNPSVANGTLITTNTLYEQKRKYSKHEILLDNQYTKIHYWYSPLVMSTCCVLSVGHVLPIVSTKAEPSSFDHAHVTT